MAFSRAVSISEFELARFFFAIACLLVCSHFFGYLFHRLRMPRVIGEIFGGLILGPTFLGRFAPDGFQWLFNGFPEEGKLLAVLYWLGLVFLMFISGFEVQEFAGPGDRRIALGLLAGSTLIPLAAGWAAPMVFDLSPYIGPKQNELAFRIIIAVAAAVTSIPVISRIFLDLGALKTRFARIVLSVATIHDVILWVALALAAGLAGGGASSIGDTVVTLLVTIVFFALMLKVLPRILPIVHSSRFNLLVKSSPTGYVLSIGLLFAAVAALLRVNVVFGALLAGLAFGLMPDDKLGSEKNTIRVISMAFFVPIYFAIVGLKLDLWANFEPGIFFGFLSFSTIVQLAGTFAAAKLSGCGSLPSFNFAVAMNTRGGPGIVLATVAFDLGIINEPLFAALVLTAVATSLAAGAWFRHVLSKGWSLA